jgi:poly [ADP-ribose] polymerase 2/3/4
MYNSKIDMDYQPVRTLNIKVGSELAKKGGLKEIGSDFCFSTYLNPKIENLISYIFDQSSKSLLNSDLKAKSSTTDTLNSLLGTLSVSQIEKAEVVLLRIFHLLKDSSCTKEDIEILSNLYYSIIPQNNNSLLIENLEILIKKYELLQLTKDLLDFGEIDSNFLYYNQNDFLFKSLRCNIEHLEKDSFEYKKVLSLLENSSQSNKKIKIKNIFQVERPIESKKFDNNLENQRLLFHGSKIENMVGILSRGILLPKIVVSKGKKIFYYYIFLIFIF